MTEPIKLTIDGVEVEAKPGQTVLQAAIDSNVYIPYLCYWPGLKPYGACRMCCVEVEGGRGTPASCTLPVANGMVVNSLGTEIRGLRESVLELLLSEHPHGCLTCHRIELCGPQDICLRHVRVMDRCVVCPKNERCELKDTVRYVNVNMESPLNYNYRNLPDRDRRPLLRPRLQPLHRLRPLRPRVRGDARRRRHRDDRALRHRARGHVAGRVAA